MTKEDLEIDEDGYPTDETLEFLEDYKNFKDELDFVETCLDLLKGICYSTIKRENNYIYIATGGWSGCEAIISSMKSNIYWYPLWIASICGGAFYLRDPKYPNDFSKSFNVTVTYE